MKKLIALLLAAVMAFAMAGAVMAEEVPEGYSQVKVFDGTYGFGDAEITAATNDDLSAFYITFECFDEEQILEGTVEDGIVTVDYDLTGFVSGDAQVIWDDAMASEEPWTAIGGEAASEEPAAEAPAAEEPAAEEPAAEAPAAEAIPVDYAFDGSWPEDQIIIAVEIYDTTDEQTLAIQNYFDYIAQKFNIKFIYSESIASAEDEIAFIDNAAAAGAQALFGYYNVTDVEAVKQCAAHGMLYAGSLTGSFGSDVDIDESLKPYYLGSNLLSSEDSVDGVNGDYLAGYELGKTMAEQGFQHIAYCEGGAAFGVQMFIDRKEGFLAGLEAGGYDHFTDADIVSGWPGTDEFAAAQTAVIAGDYDAVVSSFNVAMWFQPVMESGKEIGLAAIGEANETYKDFFDMGVVKALVYDCEETVFGAYLPLIVNGIMGLGEEEPQAISVTRWTITDASQIDAIYDYHEAGNFFAPAEAVATTFKGLNPNATVDTINEVFNMTLDEAMAQMQ